MASGYLNVLLTDGESEDDRVAFVVLSHVDNGARVDLKVVADPGALHKVPRIQFLHSLLLSVAQLDDRPSHEVRRVVRLLRLC